MRHIIAVLLQNEAGALTRVAGLFSSRGYNIESLSVAPTDDPTMSRLTLVTTGSDAAIAQIRAQLQKLVDVVQVEDMTRGDHLERELLLLRLRVGASSVQRLTALATEAGARILSSEQASFVIELTSSEAQVNRFIAAAGQFGEVREIVRSGALGLALTPAAAP